MKPSAYLINTSRGSVIEDTALINAIKLKFIAGAAVDVATSEELERLNRPNFIYTPHIAGRALEDRISTDEFIIKKLKKIMAQSQQLHKRP